MKRISKIRDYLLMELTESAKPIYAHFFKRHVEAWSINRNQLLQFPKGTLGYDLGRFLNSENLELLHKFEDHDIMHVLMKYKTTVLDEAKMQFFLIGNGKYSLFSMGTVFLSLLLMPEHWTSLIKEFKKGQECKPCSKWDFRFLLNENTNKLRNFINGGSLETEPYFF